MIGSLQGFGARCEFPKSSFKIVRQHYFGEVIALRHRARYGTSLSNAVMPVGQALTDLPLSQMESVRCAHDLAGRIGTRKEISVQGQICAQGASWLEKGKVGFLDL